MSAENVNHPSHYTQGGIECIEAIRASMPPEGFQDYCKGNVLKYIWRWRDKGGVEDLEKAKVYLQWAIVSAEEKEPDKAEEQDNGKLMDFAESLDFMCMMLASNYQVCIDGDQQKTEAQNMAVADAISSLERVKYLFYES